jgi:hypothetical protein
MATKIEYDGLDLGLVRTMKVDQKAKYDPHNTDTLYIVNRFTIETILATLPQTVAGGALNGLIPPATIDDDRPADIMARIRRQLLRPRRPFKYSQVDEGGETVLLEATADTEADNGPKPVSCTITQMADRTWRIEWEIDVAVQDCTAYQEFASNRFETTHDLDEKGYSTVTTLGRVFVRSDMKRSPDALRPVITPPVPKGFRRKSMYQVAEDGLSMAYKFTDQEFYLAPPKNAVVAKGRFSITTVPPGAVMWAQVDVHLEGKKDMPKKQLMESAVLLALRRLEFADLVADPIRGKPFVEGGSMSEELWDNVVDVTLRGRIRVGSRLVGGNDQFQFARGFWKGIFSGAFGIGANIGANGAGGFVAGSGASLGASLWRWGVGILSKNPQASAGSVANIAAAAGAVAGGVMAAADASAAPAAGGAGPQVGGATIEADFLDRFGAPLAGVSQHGVAIDPGLRGNVEFLALVAAAFRDPCVVESLVGALGKNGNLPVAEDPNGVGGTPGTGDKAGRALVPGPSVVGEVIGGIAGGAVPSGPLVGTGHAYENQAWVQDNDRFRGPELQVLIARYAAYESPSLDWRAGRLRGLAVGGNFGAGGVLINEVRQLPDEPKPLPEADDYPGWYDYYYCEIVHDVDYHQDALPATVAGQPAVAVRWANPVRTYEVRWAMKKAGLPPELPVIAADANTITLHHTMELPNMEVSGDGQTPVWTTTGRTVYKALAEDYAEVHFPVPPWLKVPMRATPAPLPDVSLRVTGGAEGAAQDARLAPLDNPAPPGGGHT